MGSLKQLVQSAKGVPCQIMTRIMMKNSFQVRKGNSSLHVQRLLQHGMSTEAEGTVVLLGKPKYSPQEIVEFVQQEASSLIASRILEYRRVRLSPQVYHSEQYIRPDKTNCTAVKLEGGVYSTIKHIISFTENSGSTRVFFVRDEYRVVPIFGTLHLKKVERQGSMKLRDASLGVEPCIWIESHAKSFFCDLVNRFRSS